MRILAFTFCIIISVFTYCQKTFIQCGTLIDGISDAPKKNMTIVIEGNKIILSFTNIGSGLMTDDGEALSEFAIAGADKKFVWANAKIEGDKVIVWSDEIAEPEYVRYAWADDPVNPNLYNKEGLPASSFEAPVAPSL